MSGVRTTGARPVGRRPGPLLNASLRTLVLPLDARPATGSADRAGADVGLAPMFMPEQWRQVEEEAASAAARLEQSGVPADGLHGGDIGFGLPRLLCSRLIVDDDGPELVFGASAATLAQRDDDDVYWTSRPAVCLSLWETQRVVTLTVERLAPLTEDDGITGPLGSSVDGDVLGALRGLLRGTGLDGASTLADAFGEDATRVVGEDAARVPVRGLRIASTERVRGRALTEGFYCVTAPEASALVADLIDGSLRDDDHEQTTGAPTAWAPLELVTQPAEEGATGAIREDSRAALINLEALSVWHEYYGFGGGGMIAAALTYVAHRAEAEREFGKLIAGLQADHVTTGLDAALDDLEGVRVAALQRQLAYRLNDGERFRSWTVPSHLATALLSRTRERMEEQGARAGEVAALLQSRLEKLREQRREKVDRRLRILSPVAALAALVGVYAALTTVPSTSAESLLSAIPDAAAVTLIIVAVGFVAGGVIEWLKRR